MNQEKRHIHIFDRLAAERNTTREAIRAEIQEAIHKGWHNPDPTVRAQWRKIPASGNLPTPEELVHYVVRRAKEENNEFLLRRYLVW